LRRKSTHGRSETKSKSRRSPDAGRKLDIIGILMMAAAVLLLLAVISYSPSDESVADLGPGDLLRLFGGDPDIQARADLTKNWLGLVGAILAGFIIRSTVGYFALAFPILLGIWGWHIFRKLDARTLAYYTNYSIVFIFLVASFFGILRLVPWMPDIGPAWSGNIGDFVAGLISRLLGTTGSVILLLTTVTILAIVVVDYDIHRTVDRLRKIAAAFASSFRSGRASSGIEEASVNSHSSEGRLQPLQAQEAAKRDRATATAAAKTPPLRAVQSSEAPTAPARIPVSIARTDLSPTASAIPQSGEAAMRSNGVIPRESVEELRGIFDEADSPPASAAGRSDARGRETPARASSGTEGIADESPASDAPAANSDEQILSNHEKKAVQQAVARTVAMSAAAQDSEQVNDETSREKLTGYKPPFPELLEEQAKAGAVSDVELSTKAGQVIEKLAVFGIGIRDIKVVPGPVVTQFELVPDSSVKISKIVSLADDLALALAARGIRIIAPIPGKSAVGIEIPNSTPEIVAFRSVVSSAHFHKARHHLPLGLGASITGDIFCDDLSRMPHLLIAGATGSGKSVGINVMINSLLFKMHPAEVKLVMIDPKKIELQQYRGLSGHFLARAPDIDEDIVTDPNNAIIALKSLELEMDMRYTKLAKAGVRHINDYNAKIENGQLRGMDGLKHYRLPYIVVIIDELADLMITAAREVEEPIARLAQLARAVGMHLVVATQRPSVDVLTGVIKANFSARIAYQVASRIDSRTILDAQGAEQLLGNGDMLYQPSGQPKPIRIQNAWLATSEVERVVQHIAGQRGYSRAYQLPSLKLSRRNQSRNDASDADELLSEAARLIVRYQQGSVSLLQRRLKIGYSRAARIVDQLEAAGIVGAADGSRAREVLIEDEALLDDML